MLYFLNEDLKVLGLSEAVSRLTWERRMDGAGTVEAVMSVGAYASATAARYLCRPDTGEIAVIEEIDKGSGGEGEMSVKGHGAEVLLSGRVLPYGVSEGGLAVDVLRDLIEQSCTVGARAIPHLTVDRGEVDSEDAQAVFDGAEAGENLLSLCVTRLRPLGMSVAVEAVGESLVCRVAVGKDLRERVVLSGSLENLCELPWRQTRGGRNFAYVSGVDADGGEMLLTVDATADGEARVECFVDGSSVKRTYRNEGGVLVTRSDAAYEAALRRLGEAALGADAAWSEARVNPGGVFRYRIDYDVGDLIAVEDEEVGTSMTARVLGATEVYEGGGYELYVRLG